MAALAADAGGDACPLCRSRDRSPLYELPAGAIVRCRGCGTAQRRRPLGGEEARRLYEEPSYLDTPYFQVLEVGAPRDGEPYGVYRRALRRLSALPRGPLLDVGCSYGAFLELAAADGWEVQGVEVSRAAADYAARERGLAIFRGTLEEAAFPPGRFAVVTLWDVVEHLERPAETLAEVARVLAPGGVAVVFTINQRSLINRVGHLLHRATFGRARRPLELLYDLHHNFFFDRDTLTVLLRGAGFSGPLEVEWMEARIERWQNVPIPPVLALGSKALDVVSRRFGQPYRMLVFASRGEATEEAAGDGVAGTGKDQSSSPDATVVVCVRNRPRQLAACLDSLLASTARGFEVVVVDDASNDETPEVAEAYARRSADVPVRLVRSAGRGLSTARNAGLAAAAGEVVAFTDSDCTVDGEWLGRLLAPFADPGVGAAAGLVEDVARSSAAERAYAGTTRLLGRAWQGRSLVGCNMAIRRRLGLDFRFDPALVYYCDEDDLARRLETEGRRVAFAPGAVVRHHHSLDLAGYLRMAWRQGQGSARLWYKHGIYLGRDLVTLAGAALTLPLAFAGGALAAVPALFLAAHLAALAAAEVVFKGKPPLEALRVLPLALLYSAVKLAAVALTRVRIAAGREPAIAVSRRVWRSRRIARRGGPVAP